MLMREQPSADELKELQSLRYNPRLVAYLERCLSKARDKLTAAQDSDEIRVTQGYAQTYQQLLALINDDPKGR